jgi:hypothetical protein
MGDTTCEFEDILVQQRLRKQHKQPSPEQRAMKEAYGRLLRALDKSGLSARLEPELRTILKAIQDA